MSRRKVGQEELVFKARGATRQSSLDELASLIDWAPLARELDGIHSASKGEPAWPPPGFAQSSSDSRLVRPVRRKARRGSRRSCFLPAVLRFLIE
jgi:hypothetical protein